MINEAPEKRLAAAKSKRVVNTRSDRHMASALGSGRGGRWEPMSGSRMRLSVLATVAFLVIIGCSAGCLSSTTASDSPAFPEEATLSPEEPTSSIATPPPTALVTETTAAQQTTQLVEDLDVFWRLSESARCGTGQAFTRTENSPPGAEREVVQLTLAVPMSLGEAEQAWLAIPDLLGRADEPTIGVQLTTQDGRDTLFHVGALGNSRNVPNGLRPGLDELFGVDDGALSHEYRLHGRWMDRNGPKEAPISIMAAAAASGVIEVTVRSEVLIGSVELVMCVPEETVMSPTSACAGRDEPLAESLKRLRGVDGRRLNAAAAGDFDGDGLVDEAHIWFNEGADSGDVLAMVTVSTGAGGFLGTSITTSQMPLFPFGLAPVRMSGHATEVLFTYLTQMHAHGWVVLAIDDCALRYIGPAPELAVTGDGLNNEWQVCLDATDGGSALTTMNRPMIYDEVSSADEETAESEPAKPAPHEFRSWIMRDGELVETDFIAHEWNDPACWN